jgi:hypothetical protein
MMHLIDSLHREQVKNPTSYIIVSELTKWLPFLRLAASRYSAFLFELSASLLRTTVSPSHKIHFLEFIEALVLQLLPVAALLSTDFQNLRHFLGADKKNVNH